jgi:osmotically-inducible protein OsmY
MGHVLRQAHDVQVDVDHGLVTLHGKIWDDEIESLIQRLERVPGVKEVRDFLTIRERQHQEEEKSGRSSHG